jgi:hypothetical protein
MQPTSTVYRVCLIINQFIKEKIQLLFLLQMILLTLTKRSKISSQRYLIFHISDNF